MEPGLENVRDTAQAMKFSGGLRVEGVDTTRGRCRIFIWVDVLLLSNFTFNFFNSVRKEIPLLIFVCMLIMLEYML